MYIDKAEIKRVLEKDGVIAFVTDTVWGLGCLPTSETAVKKIYNLKNRDDKKPLILLSSSIYNLAQYVESIPPKADELIEQHFPGALTLVLKKSSKTPNYVSRNFDTIGIRVPNNVAFKAICEAVPGKVLATTSANISGKPAATSYEEACEFLKDKVDLIVEDFGYKASATVSTVAGVFDDEIVIFRQGKTNL